MDKETFKTNIKTLKEATLDEKKLVTYISLSKELCIHINESKSLLNTFVEDFKRDQTGTKLNISYILSGLSHNNVAHITICSEVDLKNLRSNMKVVYFQHVYSVSLAPPDDAAFVAVNKFEDLSLCIGLIKSNSCIKRSSDEIANLKSKTCYQDPVIEPMKNDKSKKHVFENVHKEVVKNDQEDKNTLKVSETKPEPKIKPEVSSPKKELLNGSKSQNKRNGDKNKPQSIAGFFSKANGNTNKKVIKAHNQDTIIQAEKGDNKPEAVSKEEETCQHVQIEKMDVDDVPVKKVMTEIKSTKKGASKQNSLNKIKRNAKVDNKRKRVLHVSDSESDNEKNDPFADEPNHVDHESADEIPPTPSASTVKITSGIINPKKRRKIVDKTYTDEEGYILTKKEEIYESCSDHEEEVIAKENVQHVNKIKLEVSPKEKKTKATKKKASPPSHQMAKQPTMMNFFKKV